MTGPYRAQWRQQSRSSCSTETLEWWIEFRSRSRTIYFNSRICGIRSVFTIWANLLFIYLFIYLCRRAGDRAVDAETRQLAERSGFPFLTMVRQVSLFTKLSKPALGPAQPPIRGGSRGGGVHSPMVEWPGREADSSHLLPRLRISGAIPVHPPQTFMAWRGTTDTVHRLMIQRKGKEQGQRENKTVHEDLGSMTAQEP